MQPIDSRDGEVRREGATAIQHKFNDPNSKGNDGFDRMFAPGRDTTPGDLSGGNNTPQGPNGYAGAIEELERNDDTRHPSSKIWVRRDRKPNAYLHSGNG